VAPQDTSAAVSPIPEGGLLLHIGPPKTGSTAIQNAFHANRAGLAAAGVHYAGAGYRPREAGWAVLGIGPSVGRTQPRIELWDRLVEEIHAHPQERVCLSSEDFARADEAAVERIVSAMGADRVHLVHVVRRFDRLLPSQWQERVKARLMAGYEDWLRVVLAEEGDTFEWRNLWRPQDVVGILERWGKHVPADRITLICSDDVDRERIPRTFEALLGLPTGLLDPDPMRANRSLTANEVELLRRLNQAAARDGWSGKDYLDIGQRGVGRAFRRSTPSPTDAKIPPAPAWAQERIAEFSRRQAEAVRGSGAQVVGDPDLLLVEPSTSATTVEPVTSVDLDTAVTAVLGAIEGARRAAAADAPTPASGKGRRKGRKKARRSVDQVPSSELLRIVARRAARRVRRG
jgi:hypothetical protein